MSAKDLISYWRASGAQDLQVSKDLFKLGHYHYCLFFTHLAIEKLLKGLVYKNINRHASPIHDLVKLAEEAKLHMMKNQADELAEMSTWNIRARYDSYKLEFYKKATREFTIRWFTKGKEIILWLENQF